MEYALYGVCIIWSMVCLQLIEYVSSVQLFHVDMQPGDTKLRCVQSTH